MKQINSSIPTAHARLMMREEVLLQDAIVAVAVMECSMQVGVADGGHSSLHTLLHRELHY